VKHGPAWIIIEQSAKDGAKRLLSILPPRKSAWEVARFVEQLFVDRHASITERLEFKKSNRSLAFRPLIDGQVMHCGHDPIIIGIRAHQTCLRDCRLEFRYSIITHRGTDPGDIVHEERVQNVVVSE